MAITFCLSVRITLIGVRIWWSMIGQRRAKTLRRATVETAVAAIGPKKAFPANAGLSIQQPMNLSFAGKALLISGTTFEIERATADALAEHGANVVLTGRVGPGAPSRLGSLIRILTKAKTKRQNRNVFWRDSGMQRKTILLNRVS